MATVIRKCKKCGDPFKARTADVKRGWARFCSKSCKASEQEKRTHQHANYRATTESIAVGHPMESGYFGHGQS